jgi:alkylation response protein AidB-like acyl-CoA dehydrogenase
LIARNEARHFPEVSLPHISSPPLTGAPCTRFLTFARMATDQFQSPDYFLVDELLSDEHKLIRETVRNYVKKEISPIIEDYAQRLNFRKQIVKQLGDLGCFGPTVPVEYGGGGLDYISYGLMMQELERGDSGVRSTASVQGSLVMFPIYAYGSEEQRRKYLPKTRKRASGSAALASLSPIMAATLRAC